MPLASLMQICGAMQATTGPNLPVAGSQVWVPVPSSLQRISLPTHSLVQASLNELALQAAVGEQVCGALQATEAHCQPNGESWQNEKNAGSVLLGSTALLPHSAAQLLGVQAAGAQAPTVSEQA